MAAAPAAKLSAVPDPPDKPKLAAPGAIRTVPLKDCRVRPEGQREFDKAKHDKLVANWDPRKVGTPIVSYRDNLYWTIDGQHRIAAAATKGLSSWRMEVYTGLSETDESDLFLGHNDFTQIKPVCKFVVGVDAGRFTENRIHEIVTRLDLKVGHGNGRDWTVVSAVGALHRVYAMSGTALIRTLNVQRCAYPGDTHAFDSPIILGLGTLLSRWPDKVDDKRLVKVLAERRGGRVALVNAAASNRERNGRPIPQCLAAAATVFYNDGLGARSPIRLPDWWREIDDES